jgi:hypothetical protein
MRSGANGSAVSLTIMVTPGASRDSYEAAVRFFRSA